MDNEKLNSNTKEKRVLNSVEAAQYLGISYWLIRKLVREKKIPYYKIESKTLFTKEILDKYIQDSLEEPRKKGMSIAGITTGAIGMFICIAIIIGLMILGFAMGITDTITEIIEAEDYYDSSYYFDYKDF